MKKGIEGRTEEGGADASFPTINLHVENLFPPGPTEVGKLKVNCKKTLLLSCNRERE